MSLFRSGIMAFERVGLRQSISDLEALSNFNATDLLNVLTKADSYESGLWVDILRSRVEAISKLRDLTSKDELEKVLQLHIFDHLWMLDPSWERATGSARMEEDLRRVSPGDYALDEAGKELRGRVDIRYATSSGKHIVVELKKYRRSVEIEELYEQGSKYVRALKKLLVTQTDLHPALEVVFVLGGKPRVNDPGLDDVDAYVERRFQGINGRYVLYDELIRKAQEQYHEYLDASAKAREIETLLGEMGDIDPDVD